VGYLGIFDRAMAVSDQGIACSYTYSIACHRAVFVQRNRSVALLNTPTLVNVQVVVFGSLYLKSYLSSLERVDKAISLLPVSKNLEKEQLILQSKGVDTDIDGQHELTGKELDTRTLRKT
jgi:hypothetical protein